MEIINKYSSHPSFGNLPDGRRWLLNRAFSFHHGDKMNLKIMLCRNNYAIYFYLLLWHLADIVIQNELQKCFEISVGEKKRTRTSQWDFFVC